MDSGLTDEPKKMMTPGLIRPRLLLLKKTSGGVKEVPPAETKILSTNTNIKTNTNTNTNITTNINTNSTNKTKAETNLPIKIGNDAPTAKRPSLLKIKITDQVTIKPKPALPTSSVTSTSVASTTSVTKTTKATNSKSLKMISMDETSDNSKEEENSDETQQTSSSAIIPLVTSSGFRIMTESTVTKDNFAPPDTNPVRLCPIVIAGVGYFICHENKCLYCPNTQEKLGIILPNRSISWYQRKILSGA
jgi:hypothetical protein